MARGTQPANIRESVFWNEYRDQREQTQLSQLPFVRAGVRNGRVSLVNDAVWLNMFRSINEGVGTLLRFRGPVGLICFTTLSGARRRIDSELMEHLPGWRTPIWDLSPNRSTRTDLKMHTISVTQATPAPWDATADLQHITWLLEAESAFRAVCLPLLLQAA